MFALICFVFAILVSPFRSKIRLEAENMALRHQLMVKESGPAWGPQGEMTMMPSKFLLLIVTATNNLPLK